jgi:hypothetical protein
MNIMLKSEATKHLGSNEREILCPGYGSAQDDIIQHQEDRIYDDRLDLPQMKN